MVTSLASGKFAVKHAASMRLNILHVIMYNVVHKFKLILEQYTPQGLFCAVNYKNGTMAIGKLPLPLVVRIYSSIHQQVDG